MERLSREHVVWGYRLFLDREPGPLDDVEAKLQVFASSRDLRVAFLSSPEYELRNPGGATFVPSNGIVITEIEPGLRLHVDLADRAIGLGILAGVYEVGECQFARSRIRPGDNVLDVGANIGYFAMLMARWVGERGSVVAFEPVPENVALLERSIDENSFGGRVRVVRAALADEVGEARLLTVPARYGFNSGGAHLWAEEDPVPEHHSVIPVPRARLDSFDLRRPISFVKMDIEGAEGLALRGASELLSADRPTVLLEINPELLRKVSGETPAALIRRMQALGFECRRLEGEQLADRLEDVSGLCNVVFEPAA